jgi:hypothetical protein
MAPTEECKAKNAARFEAKFNGVDLNRDVRN